MKQFPLKYFACFQGKREEIPLQLLKILYIHSFIRLDCMIKLVSGFRTILTLTEKHVVRRKRQLPNRTRTVTSVNMILKLYKLI